MWDVIVLIPEHCLSMSFIQVFREWDLFPKKKIGETWLFGNKLQKWEFCMILKNFLLYYGIEPLFCFCECIKIPLNMSL